MIAECNSYWQNITCTGRTWFILAEFNFYWQNSTSTGRIWLPLAEHNLYCLIVTLAGRIWLPLAEWFILAYCQSYWQNMQPIKSVLLFCSADSIYPLVCSMLCCQLMQGIAWSTCSAQQWQPSINQSTKLLVYGSWKAGLNHDVKVTVWRRSCCDITSVTDIHCAFS